MIRPLAAAALALFVACALAPASAQTKTDAALLQSMLHAGGSPTFSSVTLFDVLTSNKETAELVTLTRKFGAKDVDSFFYMFDFVVADAVARQKGGHVNVDATPVPDPTDGRALAAALYAAGKGTDNHFDATRMLGRLFTQRTSDGVLSDVAQKISAHARLNFTVVLTQLMDDLKAQYSL